MSDDIKSGGIIVDEWKADVFRRMLNEQGFEYTEHIMDGELGGTIMLRVSFTIDQFDQLNQIVHDAAAECEEKKVVN